MKAVALLTFVWLCIGTVKGEEAAAIRVAVVTSLEIPDSIVNGICTETDAIWGRADVTIDWRRVPANEQDQGWLLQVTIDDQQRGVISRQEALGWITFTAAGPKPSIHLSRAGVEDLLFREPYAQRAPIAARDAFVGRALGRALSHELGHYLLNTKAHSPRGLMRAYWPSDELFAAWRGGFELTPTERAAALLALNRTR